MKREIRDKRTELYFKSIRLQSCMFDSSTVKKTQELKKEQDDVYNRWKFYDGILKANDKIK